MIFDCAFPKKARSEKRYFQCFAFRKSDSTSFPRVAMQNKMESVEGVEQDQISYTPWYLTGSNPCAQAKLFLGAVRRRGRTDGGPSDPTAEDEVGELLSCTVSRLHGKGR